VTGKLISNPNLQHEGAQPKVSVVVRFSTKWGGTLKFWSRRWREISFQRTTSGQLRNPVTNNTGPHPTRGRINSIMANPEHLALLKTGVHRWNNTGDEGPTPSPMSLGADLSLF
jgi:hypothetical protein